jgi:hypothetical protein
MDFKQFKTKMRKHMDKLMDNNDHLFVVDLDIDVLWNLYLDSFPEGTNEIYRERREYDCSCCRQFVKAFGNVVALEDNKIVTIWDFQTGDTTFQPVIDALAAYIKTLPVTDVFVTKEKHIGVDKNQEQLESGEVLTWNHFRVDIKKKHISTSTKSCDSVKSTLRSNAQVFKRSMTEISRESVDTVLDLISQKSLYKGEEWKKALNTFLRVHVEFNSVDESVKANYAWTKSLEVGPAIGKIKNHSIGVLLMDITNGMDLNDAVKRYEKIVAPSNYKRPKAIFTKKMIEQAKKKIEELGLTKSLSRRFATIEDITVNNILFANKDALKDMGEDVFDELSKEATGGKKKFDKLEEVTIDHFIKEILPRTTSMEVLLENRLSSNLVSLIAPKETDSKSMMKWANNFSWAYNGNITDSMKERVKAAGGKVDGVLRFSIQWNEEGDNQNDFDAHCKQPDGVEIFYQNKGRKHASSGKLDVDIIEPGNRVAVENIIYTDLKKMAVGEYHFFVHNYSDRGGRSGFRAEIEFDGQTHSFDYSKPVRNGENVTVAKVKLDKNGNFKITKSMDSTISSKEIWGLKSNDFHPVHVQMYSPNYWDEQEGIGHKHYFFMLKGCKNEEKPNGFFNEFLKEDLLEHKRVFEALGNKMHVLDADGQLSGLGFSSTQKNTITVKVDGSVSRMLKIVF